jgi:hypothetical protein
MQNELELCVIAAVVGALLGGAVTGITVHKLDGAKLAQVQKANAETLDRINATAAQQLAAALAKGQAAEGKVATIQQQYDQEIAQHAKDNLDYRAKLLSGANVIRVRVNPTSCGASTGSKGASSAAGTDDAATYADLSPAVAASVFTVTDGTNGADDVATRLRKLQAYVMELQQDGYISVPGGQ